MLPENSSGGKLSNISKNAKPTQIPASNGSAKARSTSKKAVLGVSNISVSIRSSKKTTDSAKQNATSCTAVAEVNKSEIGIQVDEVELIANQCASGDAPNVLLPSAKILQEIKSDHELKKKEQLKARLKEKRTFEEHSAKQEVHLTNLREFMDRGAIARNRQSGDGNRGQLGSSLKPPSDRTKTALEAYDRIKRKEEELLKMFNAV